MVDRVRPSVLRDTSGGTSFVELLVLLGFVALACLFAVSRVGESVSQKVCDDADTIAGIGSGAGGAGSGGCGSGAGGGTGSSVLNAGLPPGSGGTASAASPPGQVNVAASTPSSTGSAGSLTSTPTSAAGNSASARGRGSSGAALGTPVTGNVAFMGVGSVAAVAAPGGYLPGAPALGSAVASTVRTLATRALAAATDLIASASLTTAAGVVVGMLIPSTAGDVRSWSPEGRPDLRYDYDGPAGTLTLSERAADGTWHVLDRQSGVQVDQYGNVIPLSTAFPIADDIPRGTPGYPADAPDIGQPGGFEPADIGDNRPGGFQAHGDTGAWSTTLPATPQNDNNVMTIGVLTPPKVTEGKWSQRGVDLLPPLTSTRGRGVNLTHDGAVTLSDDAFVIAVHGADIENYRPELIASRMIAAGYRGGPVRFISCQSACGEGPRLILENLRVRGMPNVSGTAPTGNVNGYGDLTRGGEWQDVPMEPDTELGQ